MRGIDELDHYAESEDSTSLAREFFNRMENWCRALKPGVTWFAVYSSDSPETVNTETQTFQSRFKAPGL